MRKPTHTRPIVATTEVLGYDTRLIIAPLASTSRPNSRGPELVGRPTRTSPNQRRSATLLEAVLLRTCLCREWGRVDRIPSQPPPLRSSGLSYVLQQDLK